MMNLFHGLIMKKYCMHFSITNFDQKIRIYAFYTNLEKNTNKVLYLLRIDRLIRIFRFSNKAISKKLFSKNLLVVTHSTHFLQNHFNFGKNPKILSHNEINL